MLNIIKLCVLIITFIFSTNNACSQTRVKIATSDWQPFIDSQQPDTSYTIKVITEAFARVNYDVEIEFMTQARGERLIEQGLVDGYITYSGKKNGSSQYLLSSRFPGDTIGLLKKKSLINTLSNSVTMTEYLHHFNQSKFGIVKGGIITKLFSALPKEHFEFATNDTHNVNKLDQGIVDFIIIGKYSAANIITNENPHLIGQFDFIQPADASNSFNIAFSKNNPSHLRIKNDFDKGLEIITQDGYLAKISEELGFYSIKEKNTEFKRLTIGTVKNNDMLRLRRLSKIFEKTHPDIKIDWRIMEENTLRKRLLSDLAISDGQFDILTIGLQEIPFWSKNAWLSPIKNLPEKYDLLDVFKTLRDSHSYQGELHALPFYAESSVTYYRKDLFSKAGLTMSAQPTYSEILKHAKTLHKPESGIYGLCLRGKAGWGENMAFFTTMVNSYGGQWFNNKWQPQINSHAWKSALRTYKSMLTNYGPPAPEKNGYNENLTLFLKGKCGIWIDATVAAGSLFNTEKSLFSLNVGITKAPIATTAEGANWLWTWSLAIPVSSNNKSTAQQFITWATSKDYINLVAKEEGWKVIPQGTRISTYANSHYLAVAPYSKAILESITQASVLDTQKKSKPYSGIQFVEIAEFPAIGNHVGNLISEVIKGNETIDIALKKAQNYTQYKMALSGYYNETK